MASAAPREESDDHRRDALVSLGTATTTTGLNSSSSSRRGRKFAEIYKLLLPQWRLIMQKVNLEHVFSLKTFGARELA